MKYRVGYRQTNTGHIEWMEKQYSEEEAKATVDSANFGERLGDIGYMTGGRPGGGRSEWLCEPVAEITQGNRESDLKAAENSLNGLMDLIWADNPHKNILIVLLESAVRKGVAERLVSAAGRYCESYASLRNTWGKDQPPTTDSAVSPLP